MTNPESKACQSCQAEFTIEPQDFAFYQKMDVPPPTWCPDCRNMRRMAWRSEWHLFRKPDALTGEEIFTNFTPTANVKIYANEYWNSDAWDPMGYGREIDWDRPFMEQFMELFSQVPLQSRPAQILENSDYCFQVNNVKNSYLVSTATMVEDSAYLVHATNSRTCVDGHIIANSELCYGSVNLERCYTTHFSVNCEGCRDVVLSKNLIGCSNCFGCVNLRNKQYYIWNEPCSKEEYESKIQEFHLGSAANLEQLKAQAYQFWQTQPNRFMEGSSNEGVSGTYINESKNAIQCYKVRGIEDSKYCQNMLDSSANDCYDYNSWGQGAELIYECAHVGKQVRNLKFCLRCWNNSHDLTYAILCLGCSDLFGCVSLRNKQYCILNKQYTQQEYEQLVPRIIEHMNAMPYIDKAGRVYRYGEFFPIEFSPHAYNVSSAQEDWPLGKEEAESNGYLWYEQPARDLSFDFRVGELPDDIASVTPEQILGKVIECEHKGECADECTVGFTIIPQELAFLIEQGLPLPRLCFNCRHYSRIRQRQPLKFHRRQCDCSGNQSGNGVYHNHATSHQPHATGSACPNEFETAYSPDRPDIVYCESCYQAETV